MTQEELSALKMVLYRAHSESFKNEDYVKKSTTCGCFYCEKIFEPNKITMWSDKTSDDSPGTAICPYCMIDSIVCDGTGFIVNPTNLKLMNLEFFGGGVEKYFKASEN